MTSICIIVPAYNRADVLPRTLDSIISQTYTEWECIVVDDRSTDNTRDVIIGYAKKDPRIRYMLNARTKGAQGARNTGLYSSESEWVLFFDSDDIMHDDCLSSMIGNISEGVDVVKCFSNLVSQDTGQVIGSHEWVCEGNIHRALFDGCVYVDFNQILAKRELFLKIGGLDENCPSLQEFDTNIRLSAIASYHTVPLALMDYYVGGNDTISLNYEKQVRGKIYNLKKYKREWLEEKRNADRFVYETYEKLKRTSLGFRLANSIKLLFILPEMVPFYILKYLKRAFK